MLARARCRANHQCVRSAVPDSGTYLAPGNDEASATTRRSVRRVQAVAP